MGPVNELWDRSSALQKCSNKGNAGKGFQYTSGVQRLWKHSQQNGEVLQGRRERATQAVV